MPTTRTLAELRSFWPPCCPNRECPQSGAAEREGFFRHGHYVARAHRQRIPRFLCRACRRTMSSQTFNATYRLRRPDLDTAILQELAHGASMRRVAQVLGINRKTVSRRLLRARRQGEADLPPRVTTPGKVGAVAEPGSHGEPV